MCSVPDGYGSISSWYQWRSSRLLAGGGVRRVEGPLVLPDALPLRLDLLVGRICSVIRPSLGTKKPLG